MDSKKELNVYIASSVGLDYFFFLKKTIEQSGYAVKPVYLIDEQKYREQAKSSSLNKVILRIKMYVFYPVKLSWLAIQSRPGSIFIVTSNTFFAPLVVNTVKGFKNIKVIHMLYDLFPDALEVAGAIDYNSKISSWIGGIIRKTQKNSNATVYLGDLLKEHAEHRWCHSRKGKTIDISTDLDLYIHKPNFKTNYSKVTIHYGGQMGYLHDADSIIASVKKVLESQLALKVEFVFYVSGAQSNYLKKKLKGLPVIVKSAIPSHHWRKDASTFHVGLVSLTPGGASVCLPSKTYSMMASGMAILAICPVWSDLAKLVLNNKAGWVVNNSAYTDFDVIKSSEAYLKNINKLKDRTDIVNDFELTVTKIVNDIELLKNTRIASYNSVRNNYNTKILSNKWRELIEDVNN